MNFKGDFRYLGKADTRLLRDRVLAIEEVEWSRNDWRQRQFQAHHHTRTIPLLFDVDFRHSQPTAHPMLAPLREYLVPILELTRRYYDSLPMNDGLAGSVAQAYPIRMMFARLAPGGIIPAHMDRNFSLAHSHRIHIPLVTHDSVKFFVGGRRQPMGEGELWEINNRRAHQVENASPIHRIHMIVDWVIPGERCCCSAHTHPTTPCTPENCQTTDFRPNPCDCLH